jgi:hypothetical protein
MTIRIPSSLKWLIDKYNDQSRQLRQIEEQLELLSAQQSIVSDSVRSLAKVIELHEVPITAEDIRPLRTNRKQTSLAFGEVTRLIYKYLGSIPDDCDASVSEILHYCVQSSDWQHLDPLSIKRFRKAIRKRLNDMAYLKKIRQTQYGSKAAEPRYSKNKA